MRKWNRGVSFSRNRNARRAALLRRLAAMRAAKARLRLEKLPEPEPRFVRSTGLSLGLRDDVSGEVAWVEFKSIRDAIRRLRVVRREYVATFTSHA